MTVHDDLCIAPAPSRSTVHEHAWQTESAHRTSLGLLRYVLCDGCGARRVDLQPYPEAPPVALSVAVFPP